MKKQLQRLKILEQLQRLQQLEEDKLVDDKKDSAGILNFSDIGQTIDRVSDYFGLSNYMEGYQGAIFSRDDEIET
jgi:hypothetical protein